MEFIEGLEIDSYLEKYPENINNIFEQVIDGFVYLEENSILHRDIRPSNIMVDNNHNVKIIDFGFGKQQDFIHDDKKSISLNWWGGEIPNDFKKNRYDVKTEIFFIAKLFQKIIETIDSSFKYESLLSKMSKVDDSERIDSFQTILKDIKETINSIDLFNDAEKSIYQNFANGFSKIIYEKEYSAKLIMNSDVIIKNLELLHQKTMLEDSIQGREISKIFISGNYRYLGYQDMQSWIMIDFLNFFKNLSKEKQNIVLYNLETRFDRIKSFYNFNDDDIPF
jgi:serine/threonine-protein kinase